MDPLEIRSWLSDRRRGQLYPRGEFSPGWFLNPFRRARERGRERAESSIRRRSEFLSISPSSYTELCQRTIVRYRARVEYEFKRFYAILRIRVPELALQHGARAKETFIKFITSFIKFSLSLRFRKKFEAFSSRTLSQRNFSVWRNVCRSAVKLVVRNARL